MTRNPFINALGAVVYIAGVVSLLYFGTPHMAEGGQEPPLLFFISILSLFVLSALAMCVSFLLQPFIMAFEGNPRGGATLLLETSGAFACVVTLCIASLLLASSF
jgi:hypothetical protein